MHVVVLAGVEPALLLVVPMKVLVQPVLAYVVVSMVPGTPPLWLHVAVMMAAAEAMSPVGSVLGAIITFLLYGLLPISIVGYIMGAPARRRARKAKETASVAPNTNTETSCHPLTTERKEP